MSPLQEGWEETLLFPLLSPIQRHLRGRLLPSGSWWVFSLPVLPTFACSPDNRQKKILLNHSRLLILCLIAFFGFPCMFQTKPELLTGLALPTFPESSGCISLLALRVAAGTGQLVICLELAHICWINENPLRFCDLMPLDDYKQYQKVSITIVVVCFSFQWKLCCQWL